MTEFIKFKFSRKTRRQLIRGFKNLADKQKLYKKIKKAFNDIGLMAQRYGIQKYLSGRGAIRGRIKLRRRTGSLARSFVGGAIMHRGLPAIRVGVLKGPAVKYAGVHEYGTRSKGGKLPDITPTTSKYLAIPLWSKAAGFGSDRAVTNSGVSKTESPRGYSGTLKPVSMKGGLGKGMFLYDERDYETDAEGNSSPIPGQATYMLLRKVGIKPRPFATPSLIYALQFAEEKILEVIKETLEDGK